MAEAPPSPAPGKRRRGRRLLFTCLSLAALAAIAYWLRGPILFGVAQGLVVEEPAEGAKCVVLLSWDFPQVCVQAARRYRASSGIRVLIVSLPPRRIQRLGVQPTWETRCHQELLAQGVAEQAIDIVRADNRRNWNHLRALGRWLASAPPGPVCALCDRFDSRSLRLAIDRTLPPEQARRIRLVPLAHPGGDQTEWWKTKAGNLQFFDSMTTFAYFLLLGENRDDWREADVESLALEDSP